MRKLYRPSAPFSGAKVLWLPEGKRASRGFFLVPCPSCSGPVSQRAQALFTTTPMASLFKRQKEKIKNFRMG